MSRSEHTIRIDARRPPSGRVLVDVERWPEWTPSVTALSLRTPGALATGSVARLKQPGFRAADWRVTQFDDGRSFTWASSPLPGMRQAASWLRC